MRTIVYQVLLVDYLSLMLLAYYLSILPMNDKINNFIQIFNEFVVLTAIQLLFLFTDYVQDPEMRYDLGYYYLYMVAGNVIINLIILITLILQMIHRSIRRYLIRRRLKRAMK